MKLAKAFYFFAFLLAINVLVPGSNNYVEAKPKSKKVAKGGNGFIRKIQNNKVAFLSTLAATIALAIGTTFGVMHLQKKNDGKPTNTKAVKNTPAKNTPTKTQNAAPAKNTPTKTQNAAPAKNTPTKTQNAAPAKNTPAKTPSPTPETNTISPSLFDIPPRTYIPGTY
ncbi:early transcribed membrane protein [Plasmodium vinckei vinckei]|uniref:Early transcribed membrane protein n=1 Tax=Plasmodium vinckei vinckei TaxID=54757 RepID=A0A081IBU9_PLAVN|nr:early transcribed membrane protein [Plasmodium vinckei vinckei]KEG01157.1 hypothetical protein YYE_03745 [Plasmodium vinckei vinckei]VEV55130.1 early transcribed membrane protein [Plasmodium vinckei vinckei]